MERPVTAYLLVYSVDSKSSFRHAMGLVDDLRHDPSTRHKPIVVAGNKIDLERRRCVTLSGQSPNPSSFLCVQDDRCCRSEKRGSDARIYTL
jgi:GTPase SAR1 family protein